MDSVSAATPTFNLFIYSYWWITQLPFIVTLPGGVQAEQGAERPWLEVSALSAAKISCWMEILQRMRPGRLSPWASWSRQSVLPVINRDTRWSEKRMLLKCVGKTMLGHLSSLIQKAMEVPEEAATPVQSNRSNSAGPALYLVLKLQLMSVKALTKKASTESLF